MLGKPTRRPEDRLRSNPSGFLVPPWREVNSAGRGSSSLGHGGGALGRRSPPSVGGIVLRIRRLGTQPQRGGLGPPRDVGCPHEVVAQGVQICLLSQPGGEGGEGLCGVVLASVEAPIYEALDASPEGVEHGGNGEGRGHNGEGGPLAGKSDEEPLQHDYAAEVTRQQYGRQ